MNRLNYIKALQAIFPNCETIYSPTTKRFIVTGPMQELVDNEHECKVLTMAWRMEQTGIQEAMAGYVTDLQMRIEDEESCTC